MDNELHLIQFFCIIIFLVAIYACVILSEIKDSIKETNRLLSAMTWQHLK